MAFNELRSNRLSFDISLCFALHFSHVDSPSFQLTNIPNGLNRIKIYSHCDFSEEDIKHFFSSAVYRRQIKKKMSRREHDKEFEFIANWNEFMKFKIDEQNLKKPNFQFFYGALESILRSLNYDIDKIKFNTSAPDSERIYYIKFCAYIDRFYKLSGSQNRFYFYDLINPGKFMDILLFRFFAEHSQ